MSLLKKLFGTPVSNETLSLSDYVGRYAGLVRERHPEAEVKVRFNDDPSRCCVEWRMPGGTTARQFFGNWYPRYLNGEAEISELHAEQLQNAYAIGNSDGPADPSQVLPIIKPASWVRAAHAQLGIDGSNPSKTLFVRPLVADLVLGYAVDTDDNMLYVTHAVMAKMALGEEALHVAAIANLKRRLPSLEIKGGGGRFAARLDGNYDTSMVLILADWRDRVPIDGDILIAMPSRDELLLGDLADPDIRCSLGPLAQEINDQAAYPLSNHLLRWSAGELVADGHAG